MDAPAKTKVSYFLILSIYLINYQLHMNQQESVPSRAYFFFWTHFRLSLWMTTQCACAYHTLCVLRPLRRAY